MLLLYPCQVVGQEFGHTEGTRSTHMCMTENKSNDIILKTFLQNF